MYGCTSRGGKGSDVPQYGAPPSHCIVTSITCSVTRAYRARSVSGTSSGRLGGCVDPPLAITPPKAPPSHWETPWRHAASHPVTLPSNSPPAGRCSPSSIAASCLRGSMALCVRPGWAVWGGSNAARTARLESARRMATSLGSFLFMLRGGERPRPCPGRPPQPLSGPCCPTMHIQGCTTSTTSFGRFQSRPPAWESVGHGGAACFPRTAPLSQGIKLQAKTSGAPPVSCLCNLINCSLCLPQFTPPTPSRT